MTLTSTSPSRDGAQLSVLARTDPEHLAAMAERVLPQLGDIEVLQSRTGLVMLPLQDTADGTPFHLGEVLVAEAHIRLPQSDVEGYGMVLGHDLERAMAMAVLDAALVLDVDADALSVFVAEAAEHQAKADDDTLRDVAATRVDMESF